MAKRFKRSVFLFHRDLRLHDNTALIAAVTESAEVVLLFIFDKRQIDSQPYRGGASVSFLAQSLLELREAAKEFVGAVTIRYGNTLSELEKLHEEITFDGFFSNKDYTPFAKKRDAEIESLLIRKGVVCTFLDDALVHAPGVVVKDDRKPYTIYTPFSKRAFTHEVAKPKKFTLDGSVLFADRSSKAALALLQTLLTELPKSAVQIGGRETAKGILKKLSTFTRYKEDRDFPWMQGKTTLLSAHHKFGTVSAREVYHCAARDLGAEHHIIKELLWRDFFTCIGHFFPHVFGKSFYPAYDAIEWHDDEAGFARWCEGTTGFPIVDAGIRELNQTGYMHNRVRMIVASFLTKDLHIDWRRGERYFAQKLTDYDPAVNNGNWQWAASSGCDASPYFRIFNPWLQQQKFDAECLYIKRWIPELKNSAASEIHHFDEPLAARPSSYPAPILVHADEKKITERLYSVIKEGKKLAT